MSKTVDEKVVEMRFDNSNFEKNIQTSMSTLDKLKQSLKMDGATKGMADVDAAAKRVDLSPLSNAAEAVKVKFSMLQAVVAGCLTNMVNSAISAGTQIVKALTIDPVKMGYSEYELKMGSVQTIMSSTGASLGKVNEYLEELNAYSDRTIYSFSDMTNNIGKFTNAGVKLEDAVTAIKGVSNVAALSGANANEASRAMYNFSQALSSGYVKLIDWKSIENANMATVGFKKELINTAVELGVVKKAADGMYETLEGNEFNATKGFNDVLQDQWMTTEVLTKTLAKYTDENTKLGKSAYAAATEVKTFTQLFDTLKEGAQSGWAQSWEIIFGDFEEVKKLLTSINNVVGTFIGNMSNTRNEMLKTWKSLGGRDALIEGLTNAWNGLLSVTTPIKEAFQAIFPAKTSQEMGERLFEITAAFRDFMATFKLGEKGTKALKNTFKGLFATVDILLMLFKSFGIILKPILGLLGKATGGVFKTTGSLGNLLVKLRDIIKETDAFGVAMTAVVDFFSDAFTAIKKFCTSAVKAIKDFVKKPQLQPIIDKFKKFGETVKEAFSAFGKGTGEVAVSFVDRVAERLKSLGIIGKAFLAVFGAIAFVVKKIIDFGKKIEPVITSAVEKIVEFGKKLEPVFSKIGSVIKKVFGAIKDKLVDLFDNADFEYLFDGLNVGIFGVLAFKIGQFIKSLTGITESVEGTVDGFKDIPKKIGGVFDSLSNGIKGLVDTKKSEIQVEMLKSLATAIAILAASIFVLTLVDSEKLTVALAAVTTLFVELMMAMKSFEDGGKLDKKMGSLVAAMVGMAAAILILTAAMKNLEGLDIADVGEGLAGITGLFLSLVVSTKALAKSTADKSMITMAASMLIFAFAIKTLVGPIKELGSLDMATIGKGLGAVAMVMAEMAIFAKTMEKTSGSMTKVGVGLAAVGLSMLIFSKALASMGKLSMESIGIGLAGISGALTAVAIAMKLMPGQSMLTNSVAMIAIAAAMLILSNALSTMGSMSWEEIGKGLVALAGSLVIIAAAMHFMTTGILGATAMVIISAALIILASALKKMGSMSWEEIGKGLVVLAGSLAIIAAAMYLMTTAIAGAVALVIISGALIILATALRIMSGMSWEEIGKGLVVLGGALLIIAAAMFAMTTAIPGAIALLLVTGALMVLLPVLIMVGSLPFAVIGSGLLALASVFAVLGVSAIVLGPLVVVMLGLAVAVTVLGIGCIAVAVGVSLFATALTSLAVAFGALAVSGKTGAMVVIDIFKAFLGLIPFVIKVIGEAIINFCGVLVNAVPAIYTAVASLIAGVITGILTAIMTALPTLLQCLTMVLDTLIKLLTEFVPKILDLALLILVELIQLIIDFVPTLLEGVGFVIDALLKFIIEYVPKIIEAALLLVKGLLDGIASKLPDVIASAVNLVLEIVNGIVQTIPKVVDAGFKMIIDFLNGLADAIEDNDDLILDAMERLIKAIGNAIVKLNSRIAEIGGDLIKGFIKGIKDGALDLAAAAKDVVGDAWNGVKDFLGINSPAKVGIEAGMFVDKGLALGFKKYAGVVDDAAVGVGEGAVDSLGNAIQGVSDIINSDMDMTPTIRPVIDLSDVKSGEKQLSNMLNKNQSISVNSARIQTAAISRGMSDTKETTSADTPKGNVSYSFIQNNYSPKELNTVEIYRQTKNQFTAAERRLPV